MRFINDEPTTDPINPQEISDRVNSDPAFDINWTRNADKVRPGWSNTRGIHSRVDGDELNEYTAPGDDADEMSGNPYIDVGKVKMCVVEDNEELPCDQLSKDLDELQNYWERDPN